MSISFRDTVVIITGASSGIGHATAKLFAKQGASLVLAARRGELLQQIADQLGSEFAVKTLAVPTDVSKYSEVENLFNVSIDKFGKIDVWVNNAGVYLFGEIDKVPPDVDEQVIATNLLGAIYGTKLAVKHFKERRKGIVINTSSIDGKFAEAYASTYAASKHGILGLNKAIRGELHIQGLDNKIHICAVLPAVINTPLFSRMGNYTGQKVKAMKPVFEPEEVAETILNLVKKPKAEVFVGWVGNLLNIFGTIFPQTTEKIMAKLIDKDHFEDQPQPPTSGNIFEPISDNSNIHGHSGNEGSATHRS